MSICIVAEKPDVGSKIAAALDVIQLASGRTVGFDELEKCEKLVKAQQSKDGYLKIRFLGQDCYVTWGRGHLCTLMDVTDYNPGYQKWRDIPLPFIPEQYGLRLRPSADAKLAALTAKQFDTVSRLMNSASLVINATDFDREGEVIFAYIYQMAKCKTPVKRACFSSQTEEGIQEAFNALRDGNDFRNIEAAGRMRGIADWLVGINLTIAMSLKNPGQGVTSIGRVQTPTLAIVVNRELEIKNFRSAPYWTISALFKTKSGETYKARHTTEKFTDESLARKTLAAIMGHAGEVTSIATKEVSKPVPQLYSLSALQMDANSKFGLTLKQTLEIAQRLYDGGYTTYPRTNSRYLTEDMEPTVNKVLSSLSKIPDYEKLIAGRHRSYDRPRYFNNKKVESHFAIIPTGSVPTGLTGNDAKVYDLICRSVIRMLYPAAIIEQTEVITTVPTMAGTTSEDFVSNGSTIKSLGWMIVGDASKEEPLPKLTKGDVCSGEYTMREKKTKPPTRYNDKELLAAMLSAGKSLDDEELRKLLSDPKTGGIGTEATRGAIVETLEKREYISRSGKAIMATEKGIELIQSLPLESIKSAEMTARWEKRLNDIARGLENSDDFRRDIEAQLAPWIAEIDGKVAKKVGSKTNELGVNCPVCGKPMIIQKWGYGCSGWKDGCKFSVGEVCGKKLTENQARILVSSGRSPLIKGFHSKAGKTFDAYLRLDAGKVKFDFPSK